MPKQIFTRMGDGERIAMSYEEVREDLLAGTNDAADRAGIPVLTQDDVERLLDIFAEPGKIVSVRQGEEVIVTDDAVATLFFLDQENCGQGLPLSRVQSILAYERTCCADTISTGHTDYSFKQVKPIVNFEKQEYYNISMMTTAPFFYGSQPNMWLYFRPDGPYPNPADLLPSGKIKEALDAQEEAAAHLTRDLVYVSRQLYDVGCEGINFDTAASAGDADFFATLQAVSELKKETRHMAIEVGMSSEFVMGMHGDITFDGKRLAGMYPHEQLKVVEAAGADIFGPAINVVISKSTPWNLARAVTFVKECVAVADIPVHPNVGMGVCGVPMFEVPPLDAVTRTSKALVLIGKADGL
jgi:dimethylamine--corrinoid protein Co-methyltransferase